MRNSLTKILATVICAGLLAACASVKTVPSPDWRPTDSVVEAGYDQAKVAALDDFVAQYNTQSLVVVVDGEVLYSYGDVTEADYVASVRKSILAILYGPYVEDGTIDLDASLADLGMDDIGGLSPIEKTATVRDIISARSGIYHAASNGGDDTAYAPPRDSKKPGTYFLYNNWDFNAAGAIFEKTTGVDIYDSLNERLAIPLGFQDFDRAAHEKSGDPERSQYLAYHMNISARDLARVGLLMLRKGKWGGERLFSRAWLNQIVSPITQAPDMNPGSVRNSGFDYGYMWWVIDADTAPDVYKGAYAARGHFGQYLMVIPKLDMVIAHKTRPVEYETDEEYDRIRVSWDQFMEIVNAIVATRAE